VYSTASWSWPTTTVIVGLLSLGWFLVGIVAGRRLPRRSNGKPAQPQQSSGRQRREPPQSSRQQPSSSGAVELYIGNLSYEMTEADVREMFGKFGKVVSVRMIENKFNGKSKGYGFLEMGDRPQAQAAMKAMNGKEIKGRKIVVSEAKSKSRN
jgi:RNA recognition motif-containing protein